MHPEPENAESPKQSLLAWFAVEVQPHEQDLRSWLRRRFPSVTDVDDVVQESYLRLLRAWKAIPMVCARAYLFATARNVVLGALRRPQIFSSIPVTEEAALSIVQDETNVAETVCARQELTLLLDAIDALPARCREIYILRKLKGVSQREIAEQLGISEQTVQVQVVRGNKRCVQYLRRHGARC